MANFSDLIGAFLQNASAPSGQNRMGNSLKDLQQAGLGGGAADPSGHGRAGVIAGRNRKRGHSGLMPVIPAGAKYFKDSRMSPFSALECRR